MRARGVSLVLLALVASACAWSNPVGSSPTPPPVRLSGRVTATNGGQPIAGVSVGLNDVSTTTDGTGSYALSLTAGSGGLLQIGGAGIVPRTVRVTVANSRDLPVHVFGAGFDITFYRRFARNGLDAPTVLQPIRRWNQAPKVYLRTIDEAGQPIDAVTLDTVAATLINTAATWSGGLFGLATLERGTETRQGVAGWITVKWPNPPEADNCGRAQIAADGGWISLNYLYQNGKTTCGWRGSRVAPSVVRHELGHAFGYTHTGEPTDVMAGMPGWPGDLQPSAREQEYARYVYSRPIGNTDPDVDPPSAVQSFAVQRFVD